MSNPDYDKLSNLPESWFCIKCLNEALPFYGRDINVFIPKCNTNPLVSKFVNWKYKPFETNNLLQEDCDLILDE